MDFGIPALEIDGPVSVRLPWRTLLVTVGVTAVACGLAVVCMTLGDFPLTVRQVLDGLLGRGEAFTQIVVRDWRLPAALAAVVFGGLLGLGGAIFQSLTRNPLGSPDIIGFDTGAYTAVLVAMLVVGTRSFAPVALASIAGGIVTAAAVYLLAMRGGARGFRLIICGIGVSAMLGSVNSYLITRASLKDAMSVQFWAAGSLARVTWTSLVPALLVALAVTALVAATAPALRQLELGDDAAVGHGVRVGWVRALLMLAGVATGAIVTAAAGPIGFIALVAPQVAQRVTRAGGLPLGASAAIGALLLTLAHLASLLLTTYARPVPAGLITVSVGGCYFIVLLVRETRRQV